MEIRLPYRPANLFEDAVMTQCPANHGKQPPSLPDILGPTPRQVNASSLLSITRTECPHKNPDENGNCRESQNQDGKVKSFRPFWVHNPAPLPWRSSGTARRSSSKFPKRTICAAETAVSTTGRRPQCPPSYAPSAGKSTRRPYSGKFMRRR